MRIKYLCLENYIGIFNGLGLEKIEIDLSKAKHKICLIAGPNGTGKSTINAALHVLPDDNTCFIPNRTGRKILIVADEDIFYRVEIISNCINGKRTNEAYIKKNDIELNPNGNITSYKEIVFSEFNIDANFIVMSKISSEDRGLADKTPAERKKLIASRIESLDIYNEMYRNLNKKANIFKSHLNSISSKLQNLGNREDLDLRLLEIQKSELAITTTIDDNKKHVIEAETKIKMLDSSGKLTNQYNDLVEQKDTVEKQIVFLEREIKRIDSLIEQGYHNISSIDADAATLESKIINLEKSLASSQGEKNQLTSMVSDISKKIDNLKYDLETVTNKEDMNSETYQTAMSARDTKETDLIKLDNDFSESGNMFSTKSTINMSLSAINQAIKITQDLSLIHFDDMSEELDREVTDLIVAEFYATGDGITVVSNSLIKKREKILEDIGIFSKNAIELEEKISNISEYIEDISSQIDAVSIPKKCDSLSFNKCSLLNNYRGLQKKKLYLIDKIATKTETLKSMKNSEMDSKYKYNIITMAVERLRSIIDVVRYLDIYEDTIKDLFPLITVSVLSVSLPKYTLKEIKYTIDQIVSCKESLIELYNYLTERERILAGIRGIDNAVEKYQGIINNINMINTNIESLEQDKQKYIDQINTINLNIETYTTLIDSYKKLLCLCKDRSNFNSDLTDRKKEREEIDTEMKSIDDITAQIFDLQKEINDHQAIVDIAMERLKEISDDKKRIESNILIWDNFQKEYTEYNEKYNYVNILRKYSSPTQGGIQSLFMSMYMDKTLDLSNEILSKLFNGQYRILDYIINEKEFRIPFIGSGMMVDDISSGSTSQKCIMGSIISLVSNSLSSPIFNITSLDEVDSGLDQENRMLFADVILAVSDILNISQLFSISHSIEASLINVDVILLSNAQNYVDQFANSNIIYQYEGR